MRAAWVRPDVSPRCQRLHGGESPLLRFRHRSRILDWLGNPALGGEVASIDAVKDEITAGTGDLVDWSRSLPGTFWLRDTEDTLAAMTELAASAADPARQYRQDAVDKFLDSADLQSLLTPWVPAQPS